MIKIESTTIEIKQMQQKMQHYFQTHWKLFLAEGIVLIILGLYAIIPHFFSVAIVVCLGWILLFGGSISYSPGLLFFRMPGFGLWLFMGHFAVCNRLFVSCRAPTGNTDLNPADDTIFCLGRYR